MDPVIVSPEHAAILDARKQVQARHDAARLAGEAAAKDPAVRLAEARIALAREIAAADVAEHELRMDVVYREACGTYGFDAVARIPTARGSIVIRAQSEAEADVMIAMRDAHRRGAGPTPAEKTLAENNAQQTMNQGLRKTVLAPLVDGKVDLRHFDATVERYHMIWGDLWIARNNLINGRALAEGKGDAR